MTDDHGAWKEPIERVTEAASVRRVFGEPITAHDRTVIPMARVRAIFGFGGGGGLDGEASGSGGGGGGSLAATPVGAIELNADGVHIHTSPNVIARVIIVGLIVIAWNVFWGMRTARRLRELSVAARGADASGGA
jgi:uncharacterized spore protein YtfJ